MPKILRKRPGAAAPRTGRPPDTSHNTVKRQKPAPVGAKSEPAQEGVGNGGALAGLLGRKLQESSYCLCVTHTQWAASWRPFLCICNEVC